MQRSVPPCLQRGDAVGRREAPGSKETVNQVTGAELARVVRTGGTIWFRDFASASEDMSGERP